MQLKKDSWTVLRIWGKRQKTTATVRIANIFSL